MEAGSFIVAITHIHLAWRHLCSDWLPSAVVVTITQTTFGNEIDTPNNKNVPFHAFTYKHLLTC